MSDVAAIAAFYEAALIAQEHGLMIGHDTERNKLVLTDDTQVIIETPHILEILKYLQDEFEDN